MSFWALVQVFVNLVLFAAVAFLWLKLHRPAKDDPRLSKGLQLLQSKISVLEDLSDRTELQVTQLTALIEEKCRALQSQILTADRQMQKSLEVTKMFQDKVPHQEMVDRQNMIKYVRAAKMANLGIEIDQIAAQIDMSRGELEMIAKLNRERLQFSEEQLPEWAKEAIADLAQTKPLVSPVSEDRVQQSLSSLGNQFRRAFETEAILPASNQPLQNGAVPPAGQTAGAGAVPPAMALKTAQPTGQPMAQPAAIAKPTPVQARDTAVRKAVFPRIEINKNLG